MKSGSQKVPPLTIKFSKTPVAAAAVTKDLSTSLPPAGGEPYVMLQDKETERANYALAKGMNAVITHVSLDRYVSMPWLLTGLMLST